jgi:hypothetical protein
VAATATTIANHDLRARDMTIPDLPPDLRLPDRTTLRAAIPGLNQESIKARP